jgi:hypothetical protein
MSSRIKHRRTGGSKPRRLGQERPPEILIGPAATRAITRSLATHSLPRPSGMGQLDSTSLLEQQLRYLFQKQRERDLEQIHHMERRAQERLALLATLPRRVISPWPDDFPFSWQVFGPDGEPQDVHSTWEHYKEMRRDNPSAICITVPTVDSDDEVDDGEEE